MQRILLIDGDQEAAVGLSAHFAAEGIALTVARDGAEGAALATRGEHDLVLLELLLPDMDGRQVLRRIRARSTVPVLVVTARDTEGDRIAALEDGADDWLAKPCNLRELSARVRAILRRSQFYTHLTGDNGSARLAVGDVVVDLGARQAFLDGLAIELTSAEFDLLVILLRAAGTVVKREELFRAVLDREPQPLDRSIDMHVSHLRKKLGKRAGSAERIRTIRGVGYLYARTPLPVPQPARAGERALHA
jgi:two-component system, OmpR family, response regulator CpxR